MVDLDLDIAMQKQKTVKLNGKEYSFKRIIMREHLANERKLQELEMIPMHEPDAIEQAEEIIVSYVMCILDIEEEEAKLISIEQFQKLKQYMDRKGMYEQGFTDREIDQLEKKALKKQIAQK